MISLTCPNKFIYHFANQKHEPAKKKYETSSDSNDGYGDSYSKKLCALRYQKHLQINSNENDHEKTNYDVHQHVITQIIIKLNIFCIWLMLNCLLDLFKL